MKKKALITGASRGIGAATAHALARAGYDLFLVSKNSIEKLTELQLRLEKQYGISCETALCDVSKPQQVEIMLQKAGNLSVLVHNAAISHIGLLTDMSVEEWNAVIETNLSSCFYLAKGVAPSMINDKAGKMVFVSSVWGSVGASMEVAYSASKGGVNSFTKALAKELAPSNIQVNAVAFGVIDTNMNRCFSEDEMAALVEEIPADRIGRPEEAAQMILQIVQSPDYFTGQVVTMDGGWQ